MKVEQVVEIMGLSADGIRKISRRYNSLDPDGLKDGHSPHPKGKSKVLTKEQHLFILFIN
jgi:hypothetical protein